MQQFATIKVLWSAFMMCQLVFLAIPFFLFPGAPPLTSELGPETLVLMMMPGVFLIMVPLVRRQTAGTSALPLMGPQFPSKAIDETNLDDLLAPITIYMQITMVGLAFAEASAIFGLIVAFLNGQPLLAVPLVIWGLLLGAWQYPTLSGLSQVMAQQSSAT